jgi:hypothetical protein
MNLKQKIEECEYNLKQIKHFNPDPYYVGYFFEDFIKSVIDVYDGIIQEASNDFGFFISNCTIQKFENKALEKKDKPAMEFLSWYNENFKSEHQASYPKLIEKIISSYKETKSLPKITANLVIIPRYEDDISQEISIPLKNGKIKSKQELQIEIKRQIPLFLEVINNKRKNRNEPKVSDSQVMVSTFLGDIEFQNKEISYLCEIYLSVLERIFKESIIQIKKFTQWQG